MYTIANLNLEGGLIFTVLFFLIDIIIAKKSFAASFYSSIIFLVIWCIIGIIFHYVGIFMRNK